MTGMRIGLSTSSVYPESTAVAFELAGALGFDGVEIMVGTDAASQDVNAIKALRDHYQVPVLSIHAPCLLITQRVWGTDSWGKLVKAEDVARTLDADTVVVHPPFRWQRDYARDFEEGIARMSADTDVRFAVENMYPWRAKVGSIGAYSPDWDVRTGSYSHTTLDVSHCAVSHTDPIEMAADLGSRLHHIHLADGTGSSVDEHLVPGRGNQPVAELLTHLMATQFSGSVIAEISTRRAVDREQREADLAQTLAFFQLHTGAAL
ncbi:MAG: sugar phosphate isomerase/epimerase [Candidatus Nanopelagicales bacterium]|nr:sugar phosphate isomerase/epimerase [Candidatus Nanopelagicales bacterium]